jgi:hypothetical protein
MAKNGRFFIKNALRHGKNDKSLEPIHKEKAQKE